MLKPFYYLLCMLLSLRREHLKLDARLYQHGLHYAFKVLQERNG